MRGKNAREPNIRPAAIEWVRPGCRRRPRRPGPVVPRNARRSGALLGTAALAALAPGRAPAQAPDNPLLRLQYFQEQRAFPGDVIPAGAMQRAKAQLRDRWPDLVLRRDDGGTAGFELSTTAWTLIGPAPIDNGAAGRISTVAVDPTDSNTIYVGGAQGGVWKTTDGGATWTPLTDDQCSLAMGSIAIDPVDPRIIYAGTGELHFSADSYYGCGVLRSIDGGLTWTRHGATEFASSTGGARISRVLIDTTTAGTTSATTVYVASSNGFWVSRDSGLTWTRTLPGVVSDLQADAAGPQILYAAIGIPSANSTNGVYRSLDSGATWSRLASFPLGDVGRIALGASPSGPGVVYAAVQDGFGGGGSDGRLLGIWATTDGGITWQERTATRADCGSQCWYNLVIAVDPTDPNTVWFGGVPLFRSTDGGNSFTNVLRRAHVDQHAITFDPSDPSTIYIGNDGGIYRSRNDAASWQSLNSGLAITQFYAGVSLHPTDTTIVLGGTQDNGTLEARGTEIWSAVLGADGGFTAIDFADPTYSWAETQWTSGSGFSGPRLRIGNGSFDRRVTGIDTNDRALFIPPLVMDRTTASTLYFGTYRLYRTTSRGTAWATISGDLTHGAGTNGRISAIAPSAADPATIWVGTTDGNIQVTRDAGASWTPRTTGLPRRYVTDLAPDGFDPDIAIVTVSGFGSGHVFRTANGGQSWSDISGALPDVPVNAVLTDPTLGSTIYIGTDLGVFRSVDSAGSWEPFMNGLPNVAVFDLTYNRGTGVVVAATHGRSVFAFRPNASTIVAIDADSVNLIAIGDTARLRAVAIDLAGDTIGPLTPVWRSTDEAVVGVNAAGLITAAGNGEAHVVATFSGTADSTKVVVRQIAAAIADLPAALHLVEGETHVPSARVVDALGHSIPHASISWSSSNPAVAIVDPDGTVHAVSAGATNLRASADGIQATSAVVVAAPSTATIGAAGAAAPAMPSSSAGAILSLLTLDVTVEGLEAMRITSLAFMVTGEDPRATLLIVRDVNGNGLADPNEAAIASTLLDLGGDGAAVEATLQPADMRVEGGASGAWVVALRLSGESPNGATFTATYRPQMTEAVGTRSGAQDRLSLPASPVTSDAVTSTVLGAGDVLTFSENPVRSEQVIFNFREPPTVAAIYTITGRLVADLTRLIETGGRIEWDLRNDEGERVAPAVYLVIFNVSGTVMRERLLVLPPRDDSPGTRSSDHPRDRRSYGRIRSHSSASERATTAMTGSESLRL